MCLSVCVFVSGLCSGVRLINIQLRFSHVGAPIRMVHQLIMGLLRNRAQKAAKLTSSRDVLEIEQSAA